MALIGNIIKTALDVRQYFEAPPTDIRKAQERQLLNLLEGGERTAFGLYYDFASIRIAKDPIASFRAQVPIYDYEQMHARWWNVQQQRPSITWPGRPKYFALSSGTTGKESKRIPVTDMMLASFRSVGQSQIASLANFDLPADFFEKDILMLSSSADLTPHRQHLEGEISGINSANIPSWFERFYKPGKEIASIDEWEERIAAISTAAPKWDVVAIAGIPSWVRILLLKLIKDHRLSSIHDLWPNFSVYASGGLAFEPHRKSFEALLDWPIEVVDTYLASEGFFAFTARPETMAMRLAIEHGLFFEFIPFDSRGFDETGQLKTKAEALSIDQVEEGQEYALVVSTPAGAWRYFIGDTIRFTSLDQLEIVITGRTKYFLNVVGSQLSEEKLNQAIETLAETTGLEIHEFAVAAMKGKDGDYFHQWVLGISKLQQIPEIEDLLDQQLKKLNKNYATARQRALKGIRVTCVESSKIYNWLENKKKKGGQIKLPKVMDENKMRSMLRFLNNQ